MLNTVHPYTQSIIDYAMHFLPQNGVFNYEIS
jgi:hypothetical protein